MDISDIAANDYVEVDAEQRLGKVRSLFERENPKGVIVTEAGAYDGVITERQLIQSHIGDDTRVAAMVTDAPKVSRTEDVRETARMLVEGGTKIAPVFEAGSLWGVITEDAILDAVLANLDALDVRDIYTEHVVTVDEDDSMGRVINLLREHGISRLPVVDDAGLLSGIVTRYDIVDFVVRDTEKTTVGDRSGEIERLLDLPVSDEMTSPVKTASFDDSVRDAVDDMLAHDYSGVIVTPDDDERAVGGILTKTDVLRALSYTEEEHLDVQITNIDL
ncbi:CBS domain-containing protein, partial [Halobacterium salinarum]|nr:CBS domain-containing protein [Halobacterium salinarum]